MKSRKVMNLFCLICFFMLMGGSQAWANVSAYLDHNPVALDSSFILHFDVVGDAGNPDFSALRQDFDILNQQQSSNISIVNGSFSRKQQWQVHLMPKRLGQFEIPAIAFGQQRSEAIRLEVVDAQPDGASQRDIFIEASVDQSNPYVQQQVLMHVKLFRAVNIGKASLSDPEHDQAVIKKLGEDRHGETRVNARRYLLVERTYAVFPQQSGVLVLPAISFEGQVMQYNGQMKTQRVRSESIILQVKAMPTQVQGNWLPVESLEITEAWPKKTPELEVGQALTRTIEIRAKGASASQLPDVVLKATTHVKVYPDKAKLHDEVDASGVTGSRLQSIALVAGKEGLVVLPEIEVPWWNTQTQRVELARLPKRRILIKAGASLATETPKVVPHASKPELQTAPKSSVEAQDNDVWMFVSLALAALWLLTLLLWWKGSRHRSTSTSQNPLNLETEKKALKVLEKACKSKDSKACRAALLAWSSVVWPEKNIQNLGMLRHEMNEKTNGLLAELEAHLFSAQQGNWDADALLLCIKNVPDAQKSMAKEGYSVQTL
ncbi:MAG: BatD family protein [Mariprofundaceae bacterium]|nr:BatD family protein [Mariprofundaceae bacterium]